MAVPRGAGQIDGGPRADHDNGMTHAYDPVRDIGRGEKHRCHYGDPPGQHHPSGQASAHHHLHTYDLHVQSRSDRGPVLGVSSRVDLAAIPLTPCINRHARSVRM